MFLSFWIISLAMTRQTELAPPTTTSSESNLPRQRRLIWHRRDLRLHDNELYANDLNGGCPIVGDGNIHSSSSSSSSSFECISLYIFDTTYFHPKPSLACPQEYDTIWCGPHTAQGTIEAVHALREKLRSIGGELLVRIGDPTVLIPQLAEELKANEVVFGEEPGAYEREVTEHHQF